MKRDMELVRRIMLDIEKSGEDETQLTYPDGYTRDQYTYHTWMLLKEGYLAGHFHPQDWFQAYATDVTWQGHEFLDVIRDDSIWNKLKTKFGAQFVTTAFAVIQGVATEFAIKSAIGK